MVIVLLAAAGLVVVATLIGHGAIGLCGWRGWQGWAAGLGLAVLVALGGQLALDRRLAVPIAVAALVLAGLALVRRDSRQALGQIRLAELWPAIVVLFGAALPMLVAGHPGVFGVGISDDMSAHLLAADWLRTHDGLPPAAALGQPILGAGYPVGPHGVVAVLRALTGVGEVDGFDALLLAVPVATTLAVQDVLPRGRGRGVVAALIGLSYLPAAYLAQSAFKETLIALFLLVAVALLDRLTRPDEPSPARLGLALAPLGALAAGAAYVYGLPGVAWPLGAALALGAVLALRSGDVRGSLRRGLRAAWPALAVAVLLGAPDALRLGRFAHSSLASGRAGGRGNLFHALNPLEATGVWLSSDFRVAPATAWPSLLGGALVVVALVAGLVWWWRERRLAVPAGLVAAGVIGAGVAAGGNSYAAAKGLVVLAPLLGLGAAAPLLAAWRPGPLPGGARVRTAARVLGPILLAGALASSAVALRAAPVGLGPAAAELEGLRHELRPGKVLYLGIDHFAQWELRGTDLYVPPTLYGQQVLEPRGEHAAPYDLGDFAAYHLDHLTWVVKPRTTYSEPLPPNFRLVRRTRSFDVYRRRGPTPFRVSLAPAGRPGVVLDCGTPGGARILRHFPAAAILPRPVVVSPTRWAGQPLVSGEAGQVTVHHLPAGRWDVSLQYLSYAPLDLRAGALGRRLPRAPEGFGPYRAVGVLDHDAGPLTVRVRAARTGGLARLLGAEPAPTVAQTVSGQPLHALAFTRHGSRPRRVPIARACGHWVAWLDPTPA